MQVFLENGRYATLRDPISCSQCLKRRATSRELEGKVGSSDGEMGLCDEDRVSTRWYISMRIDTRRTADDSVEGLAQMAAVGLALPPETFADAGRYGYEYRCWQSPRSHRA